MNKYLKYGLLCFTGGVLATSCDVMDTNRWNRMMRIWCGLPKKPPMLL